MIRQGRWLADGQRLDKDGTLSGEMPIGKRVGVHIWAGYCLWIPWFRIAAEFLRCKDDPIAMMAFYWDCEVMQFALADMVRVDTIQPERPEPPPRPRERGPGFWERREPLRWNRGPIRRHYD